VTSIGTYIQSLKLQKKPLITFIVVDGNSIQHNLDALSLMGSNLQTQNKLKSEGIKSRFTELKKFTNQEN
jgi:hypothetical protein